MLTHPKYRADIDGLRAIAVLSVVAYHAFPMQVTGGFIGVDVFFVISGYLISSIIFENLHRDSFNFIEFYSRRIKRILPALIVVLVSCFAFGWFVLLPGEYKQLGKHIAGSAGFIYNFILWKESGYFDNVSATKPLLHLWSLGVEEQFYVVWPLLLWVAWKQRVNWLTITIAIATISFFLNVYYTRTDVVGAFYSPQTRFWELLIGSILAYANLYKQNVISWVGHIVSDRAPEANWNVLHNILSLIGLLAIAVGVMFITREKYFPGAWALLPTLGTAFIISAGSQAWLNRTVLANRILVWFGLISFPLYLWHWPLLSFEQIIESEVPTINMRILAVIISVVLAWLTYKLIEQPVRLGRLKMITLFLLIIMIVVGYVGYYTFSKDGLSFRVKKLIAITNSFKEFPHYPAHNENCDNLFPQFKGFNACKLSKKTAPEILIIGDSHSLQYYYSFEKSLPNSSVMNLAHWPCLPFVGNKYLKKNKCQEKFNMAVNFLKAEYSIKKVYLVGYWSSLAAGGFEIAQDNWRVPISLDTEQAASFKRNGEYFISSLLKLKNKEVILMRDIPDLDFNIKSCYDIRPFRFSPKVRKECAIDAIDYQKRMMDYDNVLNEIIEKFPTLKIYDPKPLFCDAKKCWASMSNYPLYFDGDHLSIYGADIVVKDLLSKIK